MSEQPQVKSLAHVSTPFLEGAKGNPSYLSEEQQKYTNLWNRVAQLLENIQLPEHQKDNEDPLLAVRLKLLAEQIGTTPPQYFHNNVQRSNTEQERHNLLTKLGLLGNEMMLKKDITQAQNLEGKADKIGGILEDIGHYVLILEGDIHSHQSAGALKEFIERFKKHFPESCGLHCGVGPYTGFHHIEWA